MHLSIEWSLIVSWPSLPSHSSLFARLSVQNFWRDERRLPVGTVGRLCALLEALHSPSTENCYLSYATNLLLEATSRSPDYNRAMFEHPLSQCKFQVCLMMCWYWCMFKICGSQLFQLLCNVVVMQSEMSLHLQWNEVTTKLSMIPMYISETIHIILLDLSVCPTSQPSSYLA